MKLSKIDNYEVISLTQHAKFLIKEAMSRMPGRRGSAEHAEAKLMASLGLLVASVMRRHGLGDPSDNVVASTSLNRRLFDAIEDWERQYAAK
jgi:hypothetical protein